MYKQNYDAKEFGNRVRMIRKQANMTQEVLAEKLYVSVDTVSKIENGKSGFIPVDSEVREAIDRALIRQFDLLPVARKMVMEELANG